MANAGFGVQIIDVSNPASPIHVAGYVTPSDAHDITIVGDRAYVASHDVVQVLDISDPTNPTNAGIYDTPGQAVGVTVAGECIYVATNSSAGLQIMEILQHTVDEARNVGQSSDTQPDSDGVLRAVLSTTQTDSIRWELSADGGASWHELPAGGTGLRFPIPGSDIRWRSSHFYAGGGVNPACSALQIDWLYAFPSLDSVIDMPDDQGGRVRLEFTRSGLDFADELDFPVAEYQCCGESTRRRCGKPLSPKGSRGRS